MAGAVLKLSRFSLSICWMSCLSRPVLMAAESMPGSCEPRTYSLRAQPPVRTAAPTTKAAMDRWDMVTLREEVWRCAYHIVLDEAAPAKLHYPPAHLGCGSAPLGRRL